MAAAAYESDDSGGASSSDESADIDFHGIKHTVFKGNMAAVEKDIEELEKVSLALLVRALLAFAANFLIVLWKVDNWEICVRVSKCSDLYVFIVQIVLPGKK